MSIHSLEKALCCKKYALVVNRDPKKKNSLTCKVLLAESIKAGEVLYCSLDTKICIKEASHLRAFCTEDPLEVCVKRSRGVKALDFPHFLAFLVSFSTTVLASLKALSMAFLASFTALSMAYLASLLFS
jgi:hypothetical protein